MSTPADVVNAPICMRLSKITLNLSLLFRFMGAIMELLAHISVPEGNEPEFGCESQIAATLIQAPCA